MSETESRRRFISSFLQSGISVLASGRYIIPTSLFPLLPSMASGSASLDKLIRESAPARFWVSSNGGKSSCEHCHSAADLNGATVHTHDESIIRCELCAQRCQLTEGERGRCRTRIVVNGELRSLVYGRPIAIHVDPIEKKPFFHFLPGSSAFSLATAGCPLHCKFCQNWQLSQMNPEDNIVPVVSPAEIVRSADSRKAPVIAFTYNEPTVFTEYLLDIAGEGKSYGLRSVLVSCGFMQEKPLSAMCDVLSAIKIDLKGFSPEFYRSVCNAELKPVLRSILQVARSGVHLEIVNLVVPSLNDSPEMLEGLCDWVAGELGPDIPIHFTRFHPDYQLLNLAPTPVSTLERAYDMAKSKGIHYPYVGNVPGHKGNNTYCPSCGETVIRRRGFFVEEIRMENGTCSSCGYPIAGVWE